MPVAQAAPLHTLDARPGQGHGRASGLLVSLLVLLGCAPDVPHPVSSHNDTYCRTCHVGRAGAPSSHDKAGCISCHESDTTGPYPDLMPHRGGDVERCSLCHRDGAADAPATQHLEEHDCYACHQATQYGPYPPTIAHEVGDLSSASCLACHQDIDHSARPVCADCHQR